MAKLKAWKYLSLMMALLLVASLQVLIGLASPVKAATPIYVDASMPDDTGDGLSWATAKKYIQSGINIVDVGGTVYVAAGTYNEAITINKSLTMQGAGQAATFVTRAGASPVITITANNVTIKDLTITDSIKLVEGIRVSINSGVTSGLTVENVDFTNISSGAIAVNGVGIYIYNDTSPTAAMSFSGLTARNCRFRGINITNPSRNIGILAHAYLNLSNFYVDNCKFSNLMTGLYIGRSSIDGLTFINNEYGPVEQANYTGAPGGIYIGDSGSLLPTTYQNITVTNNIFHDYNRGVSIWNYANGRTIGRVDITGNTFTNSIASAGVMITARWNAGNASAMEGPITISGNTFSDNNQSILAGTGMIDMRAGIESPTSQVSVTNNTITFSSPTYGTAKYGMKFRGPFTNVNISGNTLDGNLVGGTSANMPPTSGIVFGTNDATYGSMSGNTSINVNGNSIREFVHGVAIYDYVNNVYGGLPTGADLNINYDSIICNSEYGVISGTGQLTNAENTWWGCNDGPSGVGPGSGEEVSTNVDYDPWLVLNLSPNPLNIATGGTATITADMTDNSGGGDSGGWVPNGSTITFTTTGGTVNPLSDNTSSGIATTLFTAGTTPGTFSITATAPTCYSCASDNITVNIYSALIVACSAAASTSFVDFPVSFNCSPSGGEPPYTFIWDFGDGSSSTQQSPSHTYSNVGTFNVRVTVTDSRQNTAVCSMSITVIPNPAQSTGITEVESTITAETPGVSSSISWSWPRQLNTPQMTVQYVSVNPQQSYANRPVTISTNVVNTGDEGGNYNLVLKINGREEQSRMVSVGPQGTQPVKFTVTKAQPGTYTVDISGQKGSFTVLGVHGKSTTAPASGGAIAILIMTVLVLITAVALIMTFRRTA